jgi:beclin 1
MGSFSKIEKVSDKSSYDLYGTGDFVGMLFWNRRFDMGLVAFVDCINQLGDYFEEKNTKMKLPYKYFLLLHMLTLE